MELCRVNELGEMTNPSWDDPYDGITSVRLDSRFPGMATEVAARTYEGSPKKRRRSSKRPIVDRAVQ